MESRVSNKSTRNIVRPSLWTKKTGIFGIKFITFLWAEFPNICWTLFVAFLVPVDKKNHKAKFEIEKENTKLQIGRKLLL